MKLSHVLPITISHQPDEDNEQVPINVQYTGPANPNELLALCNYVADTFAIHLVIYCTVHSYMY